MDVSSASSGHYRILFLFRHSSIYVMPLSIAVLSLLIDVNACGLWSYVMKSIESCSLQRLFEKFMSEVLRNGLLVVFLNEWGVFMPMVVGYVRELL